MRVIKHCLCHRNQNTTARGGRYNILNRNIRSKEMKAANYACQIGSKCRKIVFIYSNTIYMSKLQYIRVNCNVYVHSLQNICPSRCMEFRFILPRFNVIFDIYIACAVSTYISACKLMQMS